MEFFILIIMKATTITAYAYSQSEAGAALGGSKANKCTVEKEHKQVNKQAGTKISPWFKIHWR